MRINSRFGISAAALVIAGAILAPSPANAQDKIKLSVGTSMPQSLSLGYMLTDILKPKLAEYSGGRIEVEVSLAGSLCSEHTCVEQVKLGQIDMATVSVANYGGFGKSFEILTLPYIFQSDASAEKVFDDFLLAEMRKQGEEVEHLKVIAIVPMFGFRNLQTSEEGIRTPDDVKRIKIRVTKSPLDAALIEAWGATPIPVAWSETYDALQTKLVRGIYVQNAMYLARKFDEVANHVVQTGGAYTPMMFFMDFGRYNSLPDWARAAIDKAAADLQSQAFQIDADYIRKFEARINEVNVYQPTAEELRAWRRASVQAWKKAQNWGLYDAALARRILEAQDGSADLIAELEKLGAL